MKKVITYGTYDLLHQGHINLLKRAKALGDYLIVGVTNDNFDRDRGKLNVKNNGQNDYENVVRVKVLKKKGETNSYSNSFNVDAPLVLSKGDSQTMTINVPNLTDGVYWFCIVYKTNGKFIDINGSESLNLYYYNVTVPEKPNAIVTVKSDDRQQNAIYDLKGQKVTQPKKGGVYINNGKKVKK